MITSLNSSINNGFKELVLFFPQMRPIPTHLPKGEEFLSPFEEIKETLSDDAKAVLELLNKTGKTDLNNLKNQSGLSGKKWDKAIKELTANKLVKVEKTEEGLFVEVV